MGKDADLQPLLPVEDDRDSHCFKANDVDDELTVARLTSISRRDLPDKHLKDLPLAIALAHPVSLMSELSELKQIISRGFMKTYHCSFLDLKVLPSFAIIETFHIRSAMKLLLG